jgi:hypothetical protein
MKTCENCMWYTEFIKRKDEPSNMGCNHLTWSGYTSKEFMACGGIAFYAVGGYVEKDAKFVIERD